LASRSWGSLPLTPG